jgi:HK97 family phage prohead protease
MATELQESPDLSIGFDTSGVDVEFRVNAERRTVSGMIVPWGKVAWSDGSQWTFNRGSVDVPDDVGRIKLLRDHDPTRPVGRALNFDDREDGLYATFKIMRGAAGDEVLSAAEDGVIDGFSIGPNIRRWERDPRQPGVRLVRASKLIETTITALPSFDDARVRSIAAMRSVPNSSTKELEMPDDKDQGGSDGGEATVLTDPDVAMARFEQELGARFQQVTDKLTNAFESVTTNLAQTHEKVVSDTMAKAFGQLEGQSAATDQAFAAARLKVVSEPPVYRFEGGARGDSLVRDFWRAQTERDHDAIERLRRFQEQQRDMVNLLQRMPSTARAAFAGGGDGPRFDVTRTSGAPVIPPGYRPDLFVNELERGRPIVAQAMRGTITDATPFTVPRFVSSTTAAADHVEGTNPTEGAMTLESVTVTPGAVSGRFDLTREIVDSSNPAIDAIALQTMREKYNQLTEQKAYAELNVDANVAVFNTADLSDLGGPTPAAARRKAVTDLRDLLAKYPFTRFASPTGGVMGQLITVALANAVDTAERPLLPSVGGQNAYGVGNAVDQGWAIDGLVMRPAWAITQNVGDEVALIINRSDFWAWESPLLTFRFEEKQGPAVIELALFAYFATKVLRPAGIFSLRAVA